MQNNYIVADYVVTLSVLSVLLVLEAIAGFFYYRMIMNVKDYTKNRGRILLFMFVVYIMIMLIATYIQFAQDEIATKQAYSWVWFAGTLGAGILLVGFRLHNKERNNKDE